MAGDAILVFEWQGRLVALKGFLRQVDVRQINDYVGLGFEERILGLSSMEASAEMLVTEMIQREGTFADAWADAGKGTPYEQPALNPHREALDGH